MTNAITKQILAQYDAKIKKRMENKPTSNIEKWVEEVNELIYEANMLAGSQKYKMIKDEKTNR